MARLRPPAFWAEAGLHAGQYIVMTMHRPANVDAAQSFSAVLKAIGDGARGMPVVFPVHPRTAKTLAALGDLPKNLLFVDPQPYLEFNYLVKHAKAVITDSGGVTEETTVMGVPCMTMRNTTERPETVTMGTNELIGTDPAQIEAGTGPPVRWAVEARRRAAVVGRQDRCAHRGVPRALLGVNVAGSALGLPVPEPVDESSQASCSGVLGSKPTRSRSLSTSAQVMVTSPGCAGNRFSCGRTPRCPASVSMNSSTDTGW